MVDHWFQVLCLCFSIWKMQGEIRYEESRAWWQIHRNQVSWESFAPSHASKEKWPISGWSSSVNCIGCTLNPYNQASQASVFVVLWLGLSSAMGRRINTLPNFQVKDSANWYYTVKRDEIKSITSAIRHNEGKIISLASWTAVNLFLMILIFGSQLTTSKTS